MQLTDHDRALLAPLPQHEQAHLLLTGQAGPLSACPFDPATAAAAYLVQLAYRAARRPGGMLAGRPAYEAAETLLGRVISTARCSGSLAEFGHELHQRLRLSTSGMRPDDQLWWRAACSAHGSSWLRLSTDLALTEIATAARLLDDLLWTLRQDPAEPDSQNSTSPEAS